MYGPAGERRLTELELGWLPGYEGPRPVRIGNAASAQVQLDVYGEVMDALHQARCAGMAPDPTAWALQQVLAGHVEQHWREPDEGIWEVRLCRPASVSASKHTAGSSVASSAGGKTATNGMYA